ncbi:hypothetical protein [Massilia timonae]|uniref:hypothetical protein n=1 Tax=Massilia timonae TaxID=47229 RepID=UPI0028981E89|nr:hypothetical protein [Massilia timonae]
MLNKYLPWIRVPSNASAETCCVVFKELDDVLIRLNEAGNDLNPLQRQLVNRFTNACKVFGRELLAADDDTNIKHAAFNLSLDDKFSFRVSTPEAGRAMIDDLCESTCTDLEAIGGSVQKGIIEGVADVIASIRAQQEDGLPHCDGIDTLVASVRYLAHQIAVLFEVQIYMVRRLQLLNQAENDDASDKNKTPFRVTAEEFMKSVKPPIRRPSSRDRLQPYIPQLMHLRDSGYTYEQCMHFLCENGIEINMASISTIVREARARIVESGATKPVGGSI